MTNREAAVNPDLANLIVTLARKAHDEDPNIPWPDIVYLCCREVLASPVLTKDRQANPAVLMAYYLASFELNDQQRRSQRSTTGAGYDLGAVAVVSVYCRNPDSIVRQRLLDTTLRNTGGVVRSRLEQRLGQDDRSIPMDVYMDVGMITLTLLDTVSRYTKWWGRQRNLAYIRWLGQWLDVALTYSRGEGPPPAGANDPVVKAALTHVRRRHKVVSLPVLEQIS